MHRLSKTMTGMSSLSSMVTAFALSIVPLLLFTSAGRHLRSTRAQSYAVTSEIIVHQHLRDIARLSDTSGFYVPPRIHSQGGVTLTNGAMVLLSTTPALFADRISDAISWYDTEVGSLLRIRSTDLTSSQYVACPVFSASVSLTAENSLYAVITRDGIFELKEVGERTRRSDNCFSLSLEPHDSILGLEREQYWAAGARFIMPIKRTNSLYRDTQGTLRFVTTNGAQVVENQPIRENAPLLRYRLIQQSSGISVLEVAIESLSLARRTTRLEIPIRGTVTSYLNLFVYI